MKSSCQDLFRRELLFFTKVKEHLFVKLFDKYKISKSKVFIYVLVQEDLENADRRVQELYRLCRSFNLYAQAERNKLKGVIPNKLQLEFAQRYVYGRSYKKENFESYCKRHSLKSSE